MLYYDETLVANHKLHKSKWEEVQLVRNHWEAREKELLQANAITPRQAWLDLDNITKRVMRDNAGQVIMNDLMPLARTVNIGKTVHGYRAALDGANTVQRHMSGQKPQPMDHGSYDYRGVPIPIFTNGYGRSFREFSSIRNEDFDVIADDQEKTAYDLRENMAQYLIDGDESIVVDGYVGYGLRNSPYTQQIDLGTAGANIDLTAATSTELEQFLSSTLGGVLDDNLVVESGTWYVSAEIARNLDLPYSDNYESGTRMQRLSNNRRINGIKVDRALVGNQSLFVVLNSRFVRPVVGMPVSTYAMPRDYPLADYNWLLAGAMGIEVVADSTGKSSVVYMSATS